MKKRVLYKAFALFFVVSLILQLMVNQCSAENKNISLLDLGNGSGSIIGNADSLSFNLAQVQNNFAIQFRVKNPCGNQLKVSVDLNNYFNSNTGTNIMELNLGDELKVVQNLPVISFTPENLLLLNMRNNPYKFIKEDKSYLICILIDFKEENYYIYVDGKLVNYKEFMGVTTFWNPILLDLIINKNALTSINNSISQREGSRFNDLLEKVRADKTNDGGLLNDLYKEYKKIKQERKIGTKGSVNSISSYRMNPMLTVHSRVSFNSTKNSGTPGNILQVDKIKIKEGINQNDYTQLELDNQNVGTTLVDMESKNNSDLNFLAKPTTYKYKALDLGNWSIDSDIMGPHDKGGFLKFKNNGSEVINLVFCGQGLRVYYKENFITTIGQELAYSLSMYFDSKNKKVSISLNGKKELSLDIDKDINEFEFGEKASIKTFALTGNPIVKSDSGGNTQLTQSNILLTQSNTIASTEEANKEIEKVITTKSNISLTDSNLVSDKKEILESGRILSNSTILLLNSPTAYIDGSKRTIDTSNEKIVPMVIDNRTLVPVRFISEAFDAKVSWNNDTKTATIVKGEKRIKLTLEKSDIELDGKTVAMDVAVRTYNDRIMIPLRAIVTALDKEIFWDNGLIIISDTKNILDSENDKEYISKLKKLLN